MDKQKMICAVASSSNSSSMLFSKKYDVFLSFRGEDTRRSFTSFFYEALVQKELKTFRDDEELEKGDEISPALVKAIEDSDVSVVIFSKNYATSKWCLNELSKIMDCKKNQGQVVIPVFYDIDPSHVRKQTGSYKQAFEKHEQDKNCNRDELQKWKHALIEATNLAGWHSQNYRSDPEFIKDIVSDILQQLYLKYPTELKDLVGIERNYEMVKSLLEIGSNEVRVIGIWGMGGMGKTTLASALYVKLCSQFDSHCFVESVRERSEKCVIDVLRNEIFSKLLQEEKLRLDVPQVDPTFLIRRLRCKKVLVVLDDVATSEQLENLIRNYKSFGEGSRVIVTTRDKHIFTQVEAFEVYKVRGLYFPDSLQLFCLKAFGETQPNNGYEELSEKVIAYCKGNPLALRVLGADLRSKSKEVWESKLGKLQKIQHVKIHNVLKLSFDDLDRTEQNIFLDIACFFKGYNRDCVTSILDACDFAAVAGIEVLLDKALISIPSYGSKIKMHDLIQEMGWEIIAQEPGKDLGKRSRLWRQEEVCDVLKYNNGTDGVEGIMLDLSKLTADLCLKSDSFAKMTSMRLLKIYRNWSRRFKVCLPSGLDSLSDKLRYLYWDEFCVESLPLNFCAEHLVVLRLSHSKLQRLWDGVQNLVNLKIISLYSSEDLIEIPDLSKATNLEEVDLDYCGSLHHLHPSMLSLPKLKRLNLNGCKGIESLNVNCPSLEILDLGGCASLKEFSLTSEEMTFLNLANTAIWELPSSIWRNRKLKCLSLSGCSNLECLGNMLSDNAFKVRCILPLPHNICSLSFIEELDLSGSNVESLPADIKYLSQLRRLSLDDCRRLMSLPKLPPNLQQLSARNCTSLERNLTQRRLLQHMLHILALRERQYHFFFPGDCFIDECRFHAEESSITIPYLPKSNLCGFFLCTIIPARESSPLTRRLAYCSVYENGVWVDDTSEHLLSSAELISDHVFFWYHSVNNILDGIRQSGAQDHFSNVSFEFKLNSNSKGCGVFPVYFFGSRFELFDRSSKEAANKGSQPRTMGVGVRDSNNENEEYWVQFLPALKRRRTSLVFC